MTSQHQTPPADSLLAFANDYSVSSNPPAPNSPSWLTSPKPQNPPEVPAVGYGGRAEPQKSARAGLGLFRLRAVKFDLAAWEAVKAMFAEFPDRRIPRGAPHPEKAGLFFLRYHRTYLGGEHWASRAGIAAHRASNRAAVKKWVKNKRATDPEFRAKSDANLARLVARQGAIEEGQAESASRKVMRAKSRKKSRAKGWDRAYYQAHKPQMAAAQKRYRDKAKKSA